MMRQTFNSDGRLVEAFTDNGDGTGMTTLYDPQTGEVTDTMVVTGLPVTPPFEPLDSAGALATLMVVVGVLDIDDAAHALREPTARLVHEAEAWAVAADVS
jgi:hypothetical protein